MIILDTNVVSEPLRPKPNSQVLEWLDRQAPETLYLTTISLAEILSGVELLPAGRKRSKLQAAFIEQMLPLFDKRILPFDSEAAPPYARISARMRASGRAISFADCAIAAIATTQGFSIATRNGRDFKGTGVEILDPWA